MKVLLILLGLAACTSAHYDKHPDPNAPLVPPEVTIDAAFRYGENLYLISGTEFVAVGPDNIERFIKLRDGSTEVPVTEKVVAAVNWPGTDRVYFYGPEESYRSNMTSKEAVVKPYGEKREYLQGGGPDAVAALNGVFYTFKGCTFALNSGSLLYPMGFNLIQDIDDTIPCNLDAAWSSVEGDEITLLRGNKIWIVSEEWVEGPYDFEDLYTLWSWQLEAAPESDDRLQF